MASRGRDTGRRDMVDLEILALCDCGRKQRERLAEYLT